MAPLITGAILFALTLGLSILIKFTPSHKPLPPLKLWYRFAGDESKKVKLPVIWPLPTPPGKLTELMRKEAKLKHTWRQRDLKTFQTPIAQHYIRIWPWVITAGLIYSLVTYTEQWADQLSLTLLLLTPALFGALHGFWRWHRAHPGAISGTIGAALTPGRRNKGRVRQKSQKKATSVEYVERPRGYIRELWGSYLSFVLASDNLGWVIVHQIVLFAAFAACAYPAGATNQEQLILWGVAVLGVLIVSYLRWRSIDKAREEIYQGVYSSVADHFKYLTAANNTLIKKKDRERFTSPHGAISIVWAELTDPYEVTVKFPVTYEKTNAKKREEFQKEYEANHPSNTVRKFLWNPGRGEVAITPANYPESVRWDGMLQGDWHYFVVGLALDTGKIIGFSLVKNAPHILVAGETGTGKTEVMFTIVGQMSLKGWVIALCDPKATGWLDWTQVFRYTNEYGTDTGAAPLQQGDARDGLIYHAVELYGIYDVIKATYDELERRKKINKKYSVSNSAKLMGRKDVAEEDQLRPYALIVDEALSLLATDKGSSDEIKARNELRGEILSMLLRLIVEARALMIHVLLGFQRPDTTYVNGSARDNMSIRLGTGEFSVQGKVMVFGDVEKVPALPRAKDGAPDEIVPGRGQAMMGSGQPVVNVQYMWLGEDAADLNTYLPMPPMPENAVSNAPKKAVDTKIGEDQEIFSIFLEDEEHDPEHPTRVVKSKKISSHVQPPSEEGSPFGVPSDPWGQTAKPPAPGVSDTPPAPASGQEEETYTGRGAEVVPAGGFATAPGTPSPNEAPTNNAGTQDKPLGSRKGVDVAAGLFGSTPAPETPAGALSASPNRPSSLNNGGFDGYVPSYNPERDAPAKQVAQPPRPPEPAESETQEPALPEGVDEAYAEDQGMFYDTGKGEVPFLTPVVWETEDTTGFSLGDTGFESMFTGGDDSSAGEPEPLSNTEAETKPAKAEQYENPFDTPIALLASGVNPFDVPEGTAPHEPETQGTPVIAGGFAAASQAEENQSEPEVNTESAFEADLDLFADFTLPAEQDSPAEGEHQPHTSTEADSENDGWE